jgi:hypothetical protein
MNLSEILKTVPHEIRPYIKQEYYVDEKEALKMAESCKTYADIQEYRRRKNKERYPLIKSAFGAVCQMDEIEALQEV